MEYKEREVEVKVKFNTNAVELQEKKEKEFSRGYRKRTLKDKTAYISDKAIEESKTNSNSKELIILNNDERPIKQGNKSENLFKSDSILSDEEWRLIIEGESVEFVTNTRLINSLRAGINDKLRGPIWTTLARSMNAALSHNEDLYYKLININDDALDDRINRDIKRTILYTKNKKNIKLNSRKTQIFNILKAYAVYDAEVNYCQGTNFIVALILCYINSERLSFWTFLQLMYEKNWRDLFRTSTPKLMKMMEIFQSNLKTKNSLLYKHFETIEFIDLFSAVFSPYFLTLFTYNVPIEYSSRVMDLFWLYEEKVIYDCLIHLLDLMSDKLMHMNYEEAHQYIRNDIVYDVIETYGFEKSFPL